MPHNAFSQYIRYTNQSPLISRWIATMLLRSDLEGRGWEPGGRGVRRPDGPVRSRSADLPEL